MAVVFNRNWGIYNAGEIACFDDEIEARLVSLGIAEKYEPLKEKGVEGPEIDKMMKKARVNK